MTVQTTEEEVISRLKALANQASECASKMKEVAVGLQETGAERNIAGKLTELFKSQSDDLDEIIQGFAIVAATKNPHGVQDILAALSKR